MVITVPGVIFLLANGYCTTALQFLKIKLLACVVLNTGATGNPEMDR